MIADTMLAYIDPFTGSIVLQALIAGAIGGVALFRRAIWRALALLTGKGKVEEGTEEQGPM